MFHRSDRYEKRSQYEYYQCYSCRWHSHSQGFVNLLAAQFHQMDEIVQGIVLLQWHCMLVQFHSTLHWSDRYV